MEQKTSHILNIDERKRLVLNQINTATDKKYDEYCMSIALKNINIRDFFEKQKKIACSSESHKQLDTVEEDVNRIIECRAYF
jgi:hypothetical protein